MLRLTLLSAIAVLGIFFIVSSLFISTISNAQKQTSSTYWAIGAPLPTPRTEVAATSLGHNIYVIGGFDKSGQVRDIVEVYNIEKNTWSKATSLPHPLHHTVASSFNGKIYVVGGFLNRQWTLSDKLFIYDSVKNQWKEGKSMPTARGALTASFINSTLYAVGGFQRFPYRILTTNEAYDPVSNTWILKAPMPIARHHAASAVTNGKLYVLGGRSFVDTSSVVNVNISEAYNPKQNTWSTLEPMPSKRSGIAAAVSVNDSSSIYVFGGEEPSKTFSNNEKYNVQRNEWTIEIPMPTARHGLGAAAIGDRIYVIGGGPQPGLSVTNVNEILHVG